MGACSRERAVQTDSPGVRPYRSVALSRRFAFDVTLHRPGGPSLEGWSIGGVGWFPQGLTAGERPPRALGLDVSIPLRHDCCMPGAVHVWILPPREGGPLRHYHVTPISLAMA